MVDHDHVMSCPRLPPRGSRIRRYVGASILLSTTLCALTSLYNDDDAAVVGDRDGGGFHYYVRSGDGHRRTLLAADGGGAAVDAGDAENDYAASVVDGGGDGGGNGGNRKRIALLRPFGPRDGDALLRSFDLWDTRWPCAGPDAEPHYEVDLVVSYSRRLDDESDENSEVAARTVDAIRSKFLELNGEAGVERKRGWAGCFSGLGLIEAEIEPSRDIYERGSTGVPERIDWVAGPNAQFRTNMMKVMAMTMEGNGADSDDEPLYELAMIVEADNQPQRTGWLDELLVEIRERAPFAILGSKYRGRSWDGIKDVMPASLVDHINGNAVYNMTHPLFKSILKELRAEEGTLFDAVPYDYRISQMAHEGRHGTVPEFPFRWMTNPDGRPARLHRKKKFGMWWSRYAGNPLKESRLVANFAESNYLMKHLRNEALVHGLNVYEPLNPHTHQISLVVSAWDDRRQHRNLLSKLEKSNHFFREVVVVENSRDDVMIFAWKATEAGRRGSWMDFQRDRSHLTAPLPLTSVPLHVTERDMVTDVTDVCDAPVTTEWFYHTNAYFRFRENGEPMFERGNPISRPLVPYTPADSLHCDEYPACRATLRIAREIYPALDKVVLDMDLPYHVPSRDAFCNYWRQMYGHRGEALAEREGGRRLARTNGVPLAPTATAYVAYLYRIGLAENIYSFTNVLIHGTISLFVRVEDEDEDAIMNAMEGGTPGSERMLAKKDCARKRQEAKECSGSDDAPYAECCEDQGLVCIGAVCDVFDPLPPPPSPPSPSPPPPGPICGNDGDPAGECGAQNIFDVSSCCDGLTCVGEICRDTSSCAVAGEAAKECGARGKSPAICCAYYTSACSGAICVEASDYSGGRARKLSISAPGFLVEG